MMAILCGGRQHPPFTNADIGWLDALNEQHALTMILEGGATGADYFGRLWARSRGITVRTFWANWAQHGKHAGPIRNREQLDFLLWQRDQTKEEATCIVFPGGNGTANMVTQVTAAGLRLFYRSGDVV